MQWEMVSRSTKNFYWGEFMNPYKFRTSGKDVLIWGVERVAGTIYKDWIYRSKWRWIDGKPKWKEIKQVGWDNMIAYRGKDEIVLQFSRNAANRLKCNAERTSPDMETGGSRSHWVHIRVDSTPDSIPTHEKMYVKMYCSKDKTSCNAKAR